MAFVHRRLKSALLATTYESSADLFTWTAAIVTPTVINPDVDGDGLVELVSVFIPLPAGANTSLFLRLSVSE